MKQNNLIYLLCSAVMFVSCGGSDSSNNGASATISIPVEVEEVVTNNLEKLTTTNGTLVSTASAELSSKIGGVYRPAINPTTGKPYKIGDKVRKGSILARLEDEAYLNSISIDTKKINVEIAENEYDANIALEKKGGATQLDIKNSAVKVSSAKIDYSNALLSIEDMKVTSPISGVIVDVVYQTPGVEINSGVVLFTVMDYSKMLLDVSLSESTMSTISLDLPVYVTHYSLEGKPVEATIDQISPSIDPETRTYKAVIEVDNHDLRLRPGMFVQADIVVASVKDGIIVPREMIRSYRNRQYLYLADGTTALQTEVQTGIYNDTYIEITKGLDVGDKLIVDGYETLRDKSKITVQ